MVPAAGGTADATKHHNNEVKSMSSGRGGGYGDRDGRPGGGYGGPRPGHGYGRPGPRPHYPRGGYGYPRRPHYGGYGRPRYPYYPYGYGYYGWGAPFFRHGRRWRKRGNAYYWWHLGRWAPWFGPLPWLGGYGGGYPSYGFY
jgi:hypothetical protein